MGRELLAGTDMIKVRDREYKVNAQIRKIDVFSGHADQIGLLDFVKKQDPVKNKIVFLTHGEEESMLTFTEEINKLGFDNVILPTKSETFIL